jgi:hypothetical protein
MSSFSNSNVLFYSGRCQTCNFFITQAQKTGILKYFKMVCIDGQEKSFQAKGLKLIPTIIVQNNPTPIEGKACILWLENMIKAQTQKNKFDNPNEQFLPETGINQQQIQHTQHTQQIPQNKINNPGSGNSNQQNQQGQQGEFKVPNTNVLKRTAAIPQQPPLPNTNIKGRQVPNPTNMINMTNNPAQQLNTIQSSQSNLVQINSSGSNSNTNSGPSVKAKSQLFGFLENEMSGCSDSYAYLLVDNALPKSFLPPDKDLQIYTAPEGNKLDKKTQEMYLKNMEMFRDNDKDEYKKIHEKQQKEAIQNNLRN